MASNETKLSIETELLNVLVMLECKIIKDYFDTSSVYFALKLCPSIPCPSVSSVTIASEICTLHLKISFKSVKSHFHRCKHSQRLFKEDFMRPRIAFRFWETDYVHGIL